ncbi:BsuBI/PstI family type II restriction endonuclease [Sulfobacillus thermosulfidooxidans]|uniref:BsuBI/PstI family type II restriction endonuclease n=1 Tax=Sulfobacillus thermosulfidooxidans TaxID=28034 RepID=UPI0006B486CF|nr:BsuBI/PstI family type II restriction endonuclease [Sulfobacillus thermosulfidooxidans]
MSTQLQPTDLVELANDFAYKANETSILNEKRQKGQFFTPPTIAKFMASLVTFNRNKIKVLDPGAGIGILTASLVDRIISENRSVDMDVDLFEIDHTVLPYLEQTLKKCEENMKIVGRTFRYRIIPRDFILENSALFTYDLFNTAVPNTEYDIAIANPPYFKVGIDSQYAQIMGRYVKGQPNVYFMFMAVAAELLRPGGQLVFITPRSYLSGLYFERFRHEFFTIMVPDRIHLFESRKNIFLNEKILQENIILSAYKAVKKDESIEISVSTDSDLSRVKVRSVKRELVMDNTYEDCVVRIPTTKHDERIVTMFDTWSDTLASLGIEISTGPVVTFRATDSIQNYNPNLNYPMICMHHIKPMKVDFPIHGKRNEGISKKTKDHKLLLKNSNYVLLKRFSAKEQKRRVEAAVFLKNSYDHPLVAFENHVNYLYRVDGELTDAETYGLAAFLNSTLVDSYFRIINGSTQVNATDIRALPIPPWRAIVRLGEKFLKEEVSVQNIDSALKEELNLVTDKIQEAIDILSVLGLPRRQQNDRSALVLLALLNVKQNSSWADAERRLLRIHDMLVFASNNYQRHYAENSRETFRRQTIHQFEQAALVERNPDDPTRPTNSGNTMYAITFEALEVIKSYNTAEWADKVESFLEQNSALSEKYAMRRQVHRVPVHLSNEVVLSLSPGKHNLLQKAIVEDFGAIFAHGATILYLGDTEKKILHMEKGMLSTIGIEEFNHDKLPDVVMYDEDRNWLYLIEAVTSHGPVSPKRYSELEKVLSGCNASRIYISAFLDMAELRRHIGNIAWETEIWVAEFPEHMMHMNGDKFFGPR